LAGILEPVHTVGAEALESEIAAEDFSDALRWQAGGSAPILVDQESSSVSNTAMPLSVSVDFAVILDLADVKVPLTAESQRA
jgi:hypothetical protein